MNKRLILRVFSAIILSFVFASFIDRTTVFADPDSAAGGGTSQGTGGCSGGDQDGSPNCCAKWASCPHYISGTWREFNDALDRSGKVSRNKTWKDVATQGDNAAEYAECQRINDEDQDVIVVWVGTDYNGVKRVTNYIPQSGHLYKEDTDWPVEHSHINWNQQVFKGSNQRSLQSIKDDAALSVGGYKNLLFFCAGVNDSSQSRKITFFYSKSLATVTVTLPDSATQAAIDTLGGKTNSKDFDTGDWAFDKDSKNFEITQEMFGGYRFPSGTKITVSFQHKIDVDVDESPNDPGDTKETKQKTGWKTRYNDYNDENIKNDWVTKRDPDSGTLVFKDSHAKKIAESPVKTLSFTIPSGDKTYKICEKVNYDRKSVNKDGDITLSGSGHSGICITIGASDETISDTCYNLSHSASWSNTLGRSDAESWVIKSTGSGYSHLVYARPDEQVKFLHCYYPWAHSAVASLSGGPGANQNHSPGSSDHGYHYPSYPCRYVDGVPTDTCRTKTSNASTKRISRGNVYDYCKLKAGSSWGGGNYVFDYGDGNSKNESICNGDLGRINTYKTIVSFKSPYNTSKNYGCDSTKKSYYQIVGIDPRSRCSKADDNNNKTLTVSSGVDVGKTFYQYIEYGGTLYTASSIESEPYPAYHTNRFYELDAREEGTANGTSANVVVPYNFNTTSEITSFSRQIVYSGESVSFGSTVKITPRANPDVDINEYYATITPPSSKIRTIQFTLDPDVAQPSELKGGITSSSNESSVADYISSKVGAGFRSYVADNPEGNDHAFNRDNNYNGETILHDHHYTVPDDEAGVKYCVAVAVYPADSHNKRIGEDLEFGDNADGSGQEGRTAWRWRVSDIKCTTIAKKPNVQVWGAGVYSAGDVVSSTSNKCLDWVLSTNLGCDDRHVYGSWAENEIIANGIVVNFASSNGYGYDRYFSRYNYYDDWTSSGAPGGNTSTSFANIAKQTISNKQPNGYGGYANIDISTDILDRILGRYSDSQPKDFHGGAYSNNDATNTIDSIYLGRNGGTVVIYTTKNFTINHNIIIENDGYDSIAQIPQVLIIAPNISIASNVTRVDAWLIATDRVSGTVNTCKEFVQYTTQSTGPCNQMLIINGPIFTMRTLFNRTAGAGTGNQSISPAERINLSAANYLWAYSQAEQLNQAFTTYMRELAPRY